VVCIMHSGNEKGEEERWGSLSEFITLCIPWNPVSIFVIFDKFMTGNSKMTSLYLIKVAVEMRPAGTIATRMEPESIRDWCTSGSMCREAVFKYINEGTNAQNRKRVKERVCVWF
jgi:hypothetical protein